MVRQWTKLSLHLSMISICLSWRLTAHRLLFNLWDKSLITAAFSTEKCYKKRNTFRICYSSHVSTINPVLLLWICVFREISQPSLCTLLRIKLSREFLVRFWPTTSLLQVSKKDWNLSLIKSSKQLWCSLLEPSRILSFLLQLKSSIISSTSESLPRLHQDC